MMDDVYRELEKQWSNLIHDPAGPRHYCESRMNETMPHNIRRYKHMGMVRLVTNKSRLEMEVIESPESTNHFIPRFGDVLVGVVLHGSVSRATVHLEVGRQRVCTLNLLRDEPHMVLGGVNFIPIVALPYHQLVFSCSEPVTLDLIYGYLLVDSRTNLVLNSWSIEFSDGWLNVASGMGHLGTEPLHKVLPRLPVTEPWKAQMARQHERTRMFEEELVKVTWHPVRFQQWCLDLSKT